MPRGLGSMREPLEMVTDSRVLNMVLIRKKKQTFRYPKVFSFIYFTCRALGVESPRGGAIMFCVDTQKMICANTRKMFIGIIPTT